MHFIGDVHGQFGELKFAIDQIRRYSIADIFVLGDIGIGFNRLSDPETFGDNVYCIRGNHDNPHVAKTHKSFLNDYGVISCEGYKIGYLGGGFSIDRSMRTPEVNWWEGEEISIKRLNRAITFIKNNKPDIMISHVPPAGIVPELVTTLYPSRTDQALEVLRNECPSIKTWIFGHFHMSRRFVKDGIEFIALDELESFKL